MKHRLKKINRGLVLAAVLIVGLIIYIVFDSHNFKSEKPQIEQTVMNFVQALDEQNITPEKYRENGKRYSEEDAKKRTDDFTQFLDKYWISAESNNNGYDWAVYKSDLKGDMKELIDGASGYITDFNAEIRDCKISKDGPNAALAECTVKIVFVGTEDCAIIGAGGIDRNYMWQESENGDKLVKVSLEQSCTFGLERTSDGWKITKNEWYDMNSLKTIVDDEEAE